VSSLAAAGKAIVLAQTDKGNERSQDSVRLHATHLIACGLFPKVAAAQYTARNPSSRAEVPLKKRGGIFVVPVLINGAITLDFTLDSGAADVMVPADVFSTLVRTGTITDADITGEETYVIADGSKAKSVTFTIRSLKVGDKLVENVRGSVTPAQGNLLLGQSFLEHFKLWSSFG
jgi:predicted aspartyl protease